MWAGLEGTRRETGPGGALLRAPPGYVVTPGLIPGGVGDTAVAGRGAAYR